MKPSLTITWGTQLSLLAVSMLGLFAAAFVVAQDGFTYSAKRRGTEIFVPAPEAYFVAAIFFVMSVLALLAILQARRASALNYGLATCIYGILAFAFISVSKQI